MSHIKQTYPLNINKLFVYLVTTLLFLAVLTSCHKDDEPRPVTLSGISPESGSKNTIVTINGSNFGNNLDNVKVYFNEVQAMVQSVTDNEIKTEVPRLAMTGLIKILVNGNELMGPEFTYEFSEAHVTTLAGNKEGGDAPLDGQGANAIFGAMNGIALDKDGNIIIVQTWKNSIRKITPEGLVSTLSKREEQYGESVDGPINEAKFSWPNDIAIDVKGNMFITDTNKNKIRKVSPEGVVTTLVGGSQGYVDGESSEAKFVLPMAITVDELGNIYVSDGSFLNDDSRIRKITPEGVVSTFAGGKIGDVDGQGTEAKFGYIGGLAVDNSGNIIVSDAGNFKIRKISPTGKVTTIAGSAEGFADGKGIEAKFNFPNGITVDKLDNIYVADHWNSKIRKISPDGTVVTLVGRRNHGYLDGEGLEASLTFPRAIIVDDDFNLFFTQNKVVRKITQE
ncbi:hypothetical protein FF125_15110 [Aureibaculum algae]|uniref:IPT/TIG domain-containing protein n=1 Tax=Aureibaculum algae TaxID=2584122 RepID=A0A5B7TY52_9FLAO|nr:IPT/TIG domain-containing protein [Aureibaculum algae]QCX39707.1 hypothetical protein FF125_15110 [Aureibaculum algae]